MRKLIAILIIIAFTISSIPAFAAGKASASSSSKPSMEKRVIGFWNGVYDAFGKMGKAATQPAGKTKTK